MRASKEAFIREEEQRVKGSPMYGWTRPFWTIAFAELWCSWIVLAWGVQLTLLRQPLGMEPVSSAIYQTWHVANYYVGLPLIGLGVTQLAGLFFWNRCVRLVCLLGSLSFFLFVTIAFWRSASYLPGAYIVPTYVAAMAVRFVQTAGRKE